MKDIDFLPIRYRERSDQRRARVWRALMLCCLGAFVVIIALAQLALRRPIERQLAAVAAQYPTAVITAARADQLQKDLTEIEGFAALYTYLRHPWPATQLLSVLTKSLPDSIVLTEITLDRKPSAQTALTPPAAQPNSQPPNIAESAKRDLERLRASQDAVTATLHVSGTTTEPANLHTYVSRLAPSSLFKSVRIELMEAVPADAGFAGSRFELRLQLRQGFGQPDGPKEVLADSPKALAANSSTSGGSP